MTVTEDIQAAILKVPAAAWTPAYDGGGQARDGARVASIELRHRQRARCEDRIRGAKDTGLRNLPLNGYAQNQAWCEIGALAGDLIGWMQVLAPTGKARR
jgi:Transposase DDE domain group 1